MAPAALLPLRRLGKTGLRVSTVCLGGVGLGGTASGDLYGGISDEDAIATVHRAIELGINFIDTSPLYRESERRIGLALQALPPEKRAKVMVGTKVGDDCPPWSDNGGHSPFSAEGVRSSIRHSLKMLRVVTRLETILLHDPTLAEVDEFCAPGGGMEALLDLQREGVRELLSIEREPDLQLWSHCPCATALCTPLDRRCLATPCGRWLVTLD